jgi:hypothetical protein
MRQPTSAQEPALAWTGQGLQNGCRTLTLTLDGQAAVGSCNSLQTRAHLSDEVDRSTQWTELLKRFAPFQAQAQQEELTFRGQGAQVASPAWQRAISAWAKVVQSELELGRSGASWATALTWSRALPEQTGYCKYLSIEEYGYAYTSTARCEGGDPQTSEKGWLANAEWQQFDAWFYSLAPFESVSRGITFLGRGSRPMGDKEVTELALWVEEVYARLATPFIVTPATAEAVGPKAPAVTIAPVALPDLVISHMYLEMEDRHGGCVSAYTPYGIRVVIQNRGNMHASSFLADLNGTQQTVSTGLAAGQAIELHFAGTTPGGQYVAAVDIINHVAESDETNNMRSYQAPTPTPPPLCTPTQIPALITPTLIPTPKP